MSETRLGDVIDDYCIKCRRLTNHSIVSILEGKAAKVRCRTCYNDHDYRFEQAPPSKKDLKKAELFKEVLASVTPVDGADGVQVAQVPDLEITESPDVAEAPQALVVVDTPEIALAAEAGEAPEAGVAAPAAAAAKKTRGRTKRA